MVNADEEAAKRKMKRANRPVKYMNEMGWALLAACTFTAVLLFATRRVSGPEPYNPRQPSHRTWAPAAADVSHPDVDLNAMLEEERHGAGSVAPTASTPSPSMVPTTSSPTDTKQPTAPDATPNPTGSPTTASPTSAAPTSAAPVSASPTSSAPVTAAPTEQGPTPIDLGPAPIVAEGPTPIVAEGPTPMPDMGPTPILAQGPTPIADKGPTPIQSSGAAPPPAPPADTGAGSTAKAGTVLWPMTESTQPPTANPVLEQVFTPERIAMLEKNKRLRHEQSLELVEKYGNFQVCPPDNTLKYCWNHTTRERLATCECEESMCCTRKGHSYPISHKEDNGTNWDMLRREFNQQLKSQNDKQLPPPADIVAMTDIVGLEAGQGLPLSSGTPQGELSFDPNVVQQHFFKLQAGLALYAEGFEPFTSFGGIQPYPSEPLYPDMMEALARRFAAAFLRGGQFTVAGNGDSTMAGADNCYYDSFLITLERQMRPVFAAANVNFTIRNCGHNGGFNSLEQLTCAGTMLGMEDADLAIISYPYVHPQNEEVAYELFVRRALATGVIPNIGGNFHHQTEKWLLPAYAKYGVTAGPGGYQGYAPQWWPQGGSGWSRVGGQHSDKTRSGSAAVYARNWHPGPYGHQGMADRFAFLYTTAATQALEMINTGLAESKGKLAPLLAEFQGREEVKRAVESWPEVGVLCDGECERGHWGIFPDRPWDQPRAPGCVNLCPEERDPRGYDRAFPTCLSGLQPVYGGVTFADWIVPDLSPGYLIDRVDPQSDLGPTGYHSVATLETERPESQCMHLDNVDYVHLGIESPLVIAVPGDRLIKGVIGACVMCGDKEQKGSTHPWDPEYAPLVKLQAGTSGRPMPSSLNWLGNQTAFDFEAGFHGSFNYAKKPAACFTLDDDINCQRNGHFTCASNGRPKEDALVHIECPGSNGGVVQYFWVW
eukprot:m.174622 g.174622  ORF g.174622 m.174622 type:complete len:941 (-) comp13858_c0_seq1:141-2963(-)